MSCITKLLEMMEGKEFLHIHDEVVMEGGGNYKGYEYLITFTAYGTRCGYVAIPANQDYDVNEIQCHGGVTFEEDNHSAKNLLPTPCTDMWIGFDAAHYLDMRDFEAAKKYFGGQPKQHFQINLMEDLHKEIDDMERRDPHCSHKTFEYMENECKSIIEQLIEQAA